MTLRTFKVVKAITQLAGVAAGVYAMSLGAPPLATFAMVTAIIGGPEAIELYLEGQPSIDTQSDSTDSNSNS